jgi:hypothetical protein
LVARNKKEAVDNFFAASSRQNRLDTVGGGSVFFAGFGGGLIAHMRAQGISEGFGKEGDRNGQGGNSLVANILGRLQQFELMAEAMIQNGNISDTALRANNLLTYNSVTGRRSIARGVNINNFMTSRSIGFGISDSTFDTFARNNNLSSRSLEIFMNTGSATAAVQRAVGTPMHILQRIAAQDSYAKSLDSILPQVFASFLHNGNINFVLNRSQANLLKQRDRRSGQERGFAFNNIVAPVLALMTAIATVTSSGVPVLTLDEARLYGNISEITSFIARVGKPRYEFELDRLRQHDADVERYNERLSAMSSGVGGF